MKQFKKFLVDSPLMFVPFEGSKNAVDGLSGYGSYHMQYWLDGDILIAVGVVDVLPSGICGVYLFYAPKYAFLGLGTFTALQELSLTRRLQRFDSSFKHYYMGFYIDSCLKMKYKSRFGPSYLLCPEVKTWHLTKDCIPIIQSKQHHRLNSDDSAKDVDAINIRDQDISIFVSNIGIMDLEDYVNMNNCKNDIDGRDSIGNEDSGKGEISTHSEKESKVKMSREYANLVGKEAARSMLLYLET
jgi:arginine-tRNA-protein transferase